MPVQIAYQTHIMTSTYVFAGNVRQCVVPENQMNAQS